MMLLVLGANYKTAPVDLRERLAFNGDALQRALQELTVRYGCEAVILSTCNRVELYAGRIDAAAPLEGELLTEFLAQFHQLPAERLRPATYCHRQAAAVEHLFRVVSSLDSLVLGEGQIAGQVKQAYESAQELGTVGPVLHALFQHSRQVTKRVRSETGISQGKVSVSSLAVDYVTQVFSDFSDKTILVIGAGKMGELTLRHLLELHPQRILVTNRSPEKAEQVAAGCRGQALPWEKLDEAVAQADVILSTTGSPEVIMPLERFRKILPQRGGRPVAIIDIAVPRDFDPRIGKLSQVDVLVNIDDLKDVRERTLRGRLKHVAAAEAIVREEERRFMKEWTRRRTGPAIARLSQEWDAIRQQVITQCFGKLNGQLSDADRAIIEGAFKLLQNKFLHAPIAVLREEAHDEANHGLLEAIYKLFRLKE